MNIKFSALFMLFSCIGATAYTQEMSHHDSMSMAHTMPQPMLGLYGDYAMTRESSGTAWQPESTPMMGIHFPSETDPNAFSMAHGFINLVQDHQGGSRGGNKVFSGSMLMWMGRKIANDNIFGLRAMVSAEPLLIGKRGYPLLLQVGETADGSTELIDRQHPHDAFMELAATYAKVFSEQRSGFIYAALPGEPALGPPTFMHRYSAMEIPEAPLTHHKLDSTHISFGVLTAGYIYHDIKIEGSLFNGREPNQNRWNIERPRLNSRSIRLSYNPTDNIAFQISTGHLTEPEALSPGVDTDRTTASMLYNVPLSNCNHWQTTIAWGRNKNKPGNSLYGYLIESALSVDVKHKPFARLEWLQQEGLFEEDNPWHHKVFNVGKLSVGYLYELWDINRATLGIGGLVSVYHLPDTLKPFYGHSPFSYMVFARVKL